MAVAVVKCLVFFEVKGAPSPVACELFDDEPEAVDYYRELQNEEPERGEFRLHLYRLELVRGSSRWSSGK